MDVNLKLPLLGGLSPATFMRRHWQKKPLLVRQAWPGVQPPLPRAALFALACGEGVESRLVAHEGSGKASRWRVRQGPLPRSALPPLSRAGWTLLVQGLDLHVPAAHAMLQACRVVPAARLDDLMVSWASDGGGVGIPARVVGIGPLTKDGPGGGIHHRRAVGRLQRHQPFTG